ncbi:expressed protein [Phakopsora pachyrhizi]|uniref:Expressed protein n=1 Tax=Phakopsora pachyrhizi TaxID=170000 RepID=A0AAV0BHY5_PHAPC|nr:expressed protein [Phakopsora pachyrhizi]
MDSRMNASTKTVQANLNKKRLSIERFEEISARAKKSVECLKKVRWLKLKSQKNHTIQISNEDYQSIVSEYLPTIVESAASLEKQDFLYLYSDSPALDLYSLISDSIYKTISALKKVLDPNRLKIISQRDSFSVKFEIFMLLTKDVDAIKSDWLRLLPIYRSYFTAIAKAKSGSTELWKEIRSKTKAIVDTANGALSKLDSAERHSDKGDHQNPELSDDRFTKRIKLDISEKKETTKRNYRLEKQLSEVKNKFSSHKGDIKCFEKANLRTFRSPYPKVSQEGLRSIYESLPTLRNNILILRESFKLDNFKFSCGEISNEKLNINLPNLVKNEIKSTRKSMNLLINKARPGNLGANTDLVVINGSQFNSLRKYFEQFSSQWSRLENGFKNFLQGIYPNTQKKIDVEPKLGEEITSKLDECLKTIDLATASIECCPTSNYQKTFGFIGWYLTEQIKLKREIIGRMSRKGFDFGCTFSDDHSDIKKTNGDDEPNEDDNDEFDGESGEEFTEQGCSGVSDDDPEKYNDASFLISWNRVLESLKSLVYMLSRKKCNPPFFTMFRLDKDQLLNVAHEFQRWAYEFEVRWDGEGWGVASHVDFEETREKLLDSLRTVESLLLSKNSMSLTVELMKTFDKPYKSNIKNINRRRIDTRYANFWFKEWLLEVLFNINNTYRLDKKYWDRH